MTRQYSKAELVAQMPPELRAEFAKRWAGRKEELEFLWSFWARPNQLPPAGSWSNWLILAGRGFGKTRTGAEWLRVNMCGSTPLTGGRWRHVALVAETSADARDVMVGDGKSVSDPKAGSGILQIHPKDYRPVYEPSKRRLTWPNGAVASIYNGTEPDQLRGPQHDAAWLDELAKWLYAQEAWDQLQFGLRTGTNPQVCITTTPRPIPLLKRIMHDPKTVITRGSTFENSSNLAPGFLEQVGSRYAGTRLGRQELNAEVLEDVPGALWTRAMFEQAGFRPQYAPELMRVVVAIDPSGTKGQGDNGDCVGIIVAGKGRDGRAYVLADRTCKLPPAQWGRKAVEAYREFKADRIVAEVNFGGAMVEHVVRVAGQQMGIYNLSYRNVAASRGKVVRAEPVAALYEQGRVSHVGGAAQFSSLEDQACSMTPDGFVGEGSPDRVDALVWALTEMMLGGPGPLVVTRFRV